MKDDHKADGDGAKAETVQTLTVHDADYTYPATMRFLHKVLLSVPFDRGF
jgi:hypothetical protein